MDIPAAQAPRVDFLIVGAQKAGTTALFDHLSDEPAYGLSRIKEVHFFDDDSRDWGCPDYGAYHSEFPADAGLIRGEATPIYLYWPQSLERIAAYNPQIRLIVMLRDPVERAWSHWRMERARGETEPFSWCIRQGRARLLAATPWGHHRDFSYVERGFYGEQVERLFGLFPRDQVLLVRAEDLRTDPTAVLTQVSRFLGAPPPAPVPPRQVHVGRDMPGLGQEDVAYLRRLYARDMARLADLIGQSFW